MRHGRLNSRYVLLLLAALAFATVTVGLLHSHSDVGQACQVCHVAHLPALQAAPAAQVAPPLFAGIHTPAEEFFSHEVPVVSLASPRAPPVTL